MLRSFKTLFGLMAVVSAALLSACGGGGSDAPSAINDGVGPGNPSDCPRARLDDVWLSARLSCLAPGQKFLTAAQAAGARADRAYIFGQQVYNLQFNNVLGPDVSRYVRHAVCVRNAPENLSPVPLAADLGTALGLNVLATGATFVPPGVSGSSFGYGGINDTNTLQVACDPARHPIIVDYDTGRIASVNPGALAAVTVFDR